MYLYVEQQYGKYSKSGDITSESGCLCNSDDFRDMLASRLGEPDEPYLKSSVFIEITTALYSRKELDKPKETVVENKLLFMKYHRSEI